MACSALKLRQCVKNQIIYKHATSYSVIFNRYFCIKNDKPDKDIKVKTEEEKDKANLTQEASIGEAVQEPKLSEKISKSSSEESTEAAKKKLLSLLSEVNVVSDQPPGYKSDLNLARPLKRISKKERFPDFYKKRPPDEEIKLAMKAVVSNINGDPKAMESELQQKLTSINLIKEEDTINLTKEDAINHTKGATKKLSKDDIINLSKQEKDNAEKQADSMINAELSKNLMSSVEKIASTVAESPIQPPSALTSRLLRLSVESKTSAEQRKSVSETLSGMRIEGASSDIQKQRRDADQIKPSRAESVQRTAQMHPSRAGSVQRTTGQMHPSRIGSVQRRTTDQMNRARITLKPQMKPKIDLFGASPLDIFPAATDKTVDTKNTVWEKLQEKEMKLLVQFAPTNAFEEMIMWTEQGKHWKFPIDNEIDMGAEENVGFHEHVFLEHHLEGFPTKGPIRYFMELVVVGLSKNPYITVDRKIENINWFRDYFKDKEDILKETGAIEE